MRDARPRYTPAVEVKLLPRTLCRLTARDVGERRVDEDRGLAIGVTPVVDMSSSVYVITVRIDAHIRQGLAVLGSTATPWRGGARGTMAT